MHEGVETLVGLFLAFVGEVEVEHGGFELGVSQVPLDESGINARFEQMGGVRMAEGMDGDAHFADPGALFGFAKGPLDTGATHGESRRWTLGVIAPGGGKEPGGVAMGFPIGAEQCQGLFGEGNVAVFGALAAVDMDLEARAIDVGDLEEKSFVEPEAQAVDSREVDLVVQGGGGGEEALDLLHTEDGGEPVGGLWAQECQRGPIAFEDVLIKKADAAVAEAHRSWRQAIDVFAVQEITLEILFGDAVGGFVIELRQETHFPDIGFLRPFAFAAEVEGRDHLLT
jgi:hypothetical protein